MQISDLGQARCTDMFKPWLYCVYCVPVCSIRTVRREGSRTTAVWIFLRWNGKTKMISYVEILRNSMENCIVHCKYTIWHALLCCNGTLCFHQFFQLILFYVKLILRIDKGMSISVKCAGLTMQP